MPRRNVQPMSRTHPELRTPPALPEGGLRVIALGGLGEIGRNMTVFEHAGKLLIVDCGVLFLTFLSVLPVGAEALRPASAGPDTPSTE